MKAACELIGDHRHLVNAGTIGREATPRRPRAKPFDRLARREGDRDDLVSCLDQGDAEQGGETTARPDFGPRPVIFARKSLVAIER